MNELVMEVRDVAESERLVVGVAAPYGEVTHLVADAAGERIHPGAFTRSVKHRGDKIPLLLNHATDRVMGRSRRFGDSATELVGFFGVNEGETGDALLGDLTRGYYGGLSVGFMVTPGGVKRGDDGVREIREAKLVEVSLVGVPAYEGAGLLAVRNAQDLAALLAPFRTPAPAVNLTPLPPLVYRPR